MTVNDSYSTLRNTVCSFCDANCGGICDDMKALHPERDCLISVGVEKKESHCPRKLWWKECSCVWVYRRKRYSGLRYSINSVKRNLNAYNLAICGDVPEYFSGVRIDSPVTTSKIDDSLIKLQRIIDCKEVTDTFLWMYDDTFILSPMTMEELAIPRYGLSPETGSPLWNEVYKRTQLLLLEQNLPTRNYSTHYPVVYNKNKLQRVLDTYKPPYLVESIYYNVVAENPLPLDCSFQFSRDCGPNWELQENVKVLNVKQFTPIVQKVVGDLCY